MTQIHEARKGNRTEALRQIAAEEGLTEDTLMELVSQGKVVIPQNPNHSPIHPVGIGQKLRTKVNVNIGSSEDFPQIKDTLGPCG